MRRLAIGLAAALLLGAVVLLITLSFLDDVVRREIETRGSALTRTEVRIESVSLSLRRGTATLRGFSVANPPGYRAASALVVDEAAVDVELGTLFADRLVVRRIDINGPRVFYEIDAEGTANLDVIRKAIESGPDAGEPGAAATPSAPRSPAGSRKARGRQPRMLIERFSLERGEVHIDTSATGGRAHVQTLEAFELTGIGADGAGATPEQVARTIVAAIVRDVALSLAAGEIERALGKTVGGPLGDVIKKGGAEALGKGIGNVLDKVLGR